MKNIIHILSIFCLFSLSLSINAAHHEWNLSTKESKISYGSIKKNTVGEVNHFKTISGNINKDGKVEVNIDLSSIETYIKIRNERMLKHVFNIASPNATLTANIDMNEIKSLAIGDTILIDTAGILSILGNDIEIDTTFFIARLSENRMAAITDEMIMLKTATLGVDAGIDILMKLAKLNDITRVSPVNLRFVFEKK